MTEFIDGAVRTLSPMRIGSRVTTNHPSNPDVCGLMDPAVVTGLWWMFFSSLGLSLRRLIIDYLLLFNNADFTRNGGIRLERLAISNLRSQSLGSDWAPSM